MTQPAIAPRHLQTSTGKELYHLRLQGRILINHDSPLIINIYLYQNAAAKSNTWTNILSCIILAVNCSPDSQSKLTSVRLSYLPSPSITPYLLPNPIPWHPAPMQNQVCTVLSYRAGQVSMAFRQSLLSLTTGRPGHRASRLASTGKYLILKSLNAAMWP